MEEYALIINVNVKRILLAVDVNIDVSIIEIYLNLIIDIYQLANHGPMCDTIATHCGQYLGSFPAPCDLICENDGVCLNNKCKCEEDFVGSRCEYRCEYN